MSKPPVPPGPVVTLVYRVAPEKRAALLAFLNEAFPFYERHGGTTMALYEDLNEPGRLLELVAYASAEEWKRDREAMERDPEMKAKLAEWRKLFDGPLEVREFAPLATS